MFWRRPYLLVGWLWYLGTLVPVIGLVPILGGQSMADRYTYIPLIGIFLALSWGLADLSAWSGLPKWAPAALAALSLLPFAATAWTQVGYWRNSKALWNHVLEVDPDNYVGHHNLGSVLSDEGALDQAVEHLSRAAAANSNGGLSHYALANILAYQGQIDEAIRYYSTAVDINPNWPEAHKRLGRWDRKGKLDKARDHYLRSLRQFPGDREAHESWPQSWSGSARWKRRRRT